MAMKYKKGDRVRTTSDPPLRPEFWRKRYTISGIYKDRYKIDTHCGEMFFLEKYLVLIKKKKTWL